ncbi:MAG: hypothetical protein Q8882_03345, partial [Bacillota bacterium]|nr:hypothetical protein [Bacillota bacterium]
YDIIGDKTPLKTDCGKLCDGACCKDTESGSGMYLYPFEEKLLEGKGLTIEKSDFIYAKGKSALFASCPGVCSREFRPLACRIFPLLPYKKDDEVTVIIDPRSFSMCPLAFKGMYHLDRDFIKRVLLVSKLLCKVPVINEFIAKQQKLAEEANFLNL